MTTPIAPPAGGNPSPDPPTPSDTFSKPDPKVAVRKETKQALVVIGAALIILAIVVAALSWGLGSKTTETEPSKSAAASTVEKTKKTYSGPSDSLLMAVIGSGAALILVGFLYGRISSIKLPGGVDIGLTAEEKEKAATKTLEKLESLPGETSPADAAKAIQHAQDAVLAVKATQHAEAVAQVPDEQIVELAESAAQAVTES